MNGAALAARRLSLSGIGGSCRLYRKLKSPKRLALSAEQPRGVEHATAACNQMQKKRSKMTFSRRLTTSFRIVRTHLKTQK